MTETNANASIHVLADETLGGIKREYVEVDRKAEVGERIIIVKADCQSEYRNGDMAFVSRFVKDDSRLGYYVESILANGQSIALYDREYHVLEPTSIVHIDGPDGTQRYELTDRKAEVGEMVIHLYEGESDGIAREVRKTDDKGAEVDPYADEEGWWVGFDHGGYRVLVPVESAEADEPQPVDAVFAIGNVAQEVAKLKRTVERLENEIDTLHKDNRTLGEELARLKESATGVKGEKLFTADELAAIIERLLMRP